MTRPPSPPSGGADPFASRTAWQFNAYVTAVAIDPVSGVAGFALGDGGVRLVPLASQSAHVSRVAKAHAGAVLALAAHPLGGFVSGGDDGALVRVAADGATRALSTAQGRWIEPLVILPDGSALHGLGRMARLTTPDGAGTAREFGPHPSTVTAIGRVGRDRFAVAHYNGATIWRLDDPTAEPLSLVWKGSHIALAASADGRFLATAMQEGDVHAWRLPIEGEAGPIADFRMAGYPSKVESLSWSVDGRLLVTSGSDAPIGWPFDGPGPEGRAPEEFARPSPGPAPRPPGAPRQAPEEPPLITRAACNPARPLVAAGDATGAVGVARLDDGTRVGPPMAVSRRAPVSALAWAADGTILVAGCEDGRAIIATLGTGSSAERVD